MPSPKPVKKFAAFLYYLIILYYLLPFSPIHLYYTVHHQQTAGSYHIVGNQKSGVLSYHKTIVKSEVPFPKKDRSRFDFDGSVLIPPLYSKEVIFTNKKVAFSYLQLTHSNPLILRNSNRGPPSPFC